MAAPIGNMVVGNGTCCHSAKKARTELVVVDSPRAIISAHPNWRDWGNLTDGPAGKIAERVLLDDVADYLRFRAVCSQWRRCTESPHTHNCMDRRFHPRRWIMLPRQTLDDIWKHKRRDFLNISTGQRIQVDLPELRRQFIFGLTSEGLILMCDKRTYAVQLLNPLTRQLTALPDATTLLCPPNSEDISRSSRLERLQMYGAGLADHSSIALNFDDDGQVLAITKPNVERWSWCALPGSDPMITTLSFAGRFYGVTKKGIMVIDLTAGGQRPQLEVAVEMNEDLFLFHLDFVNLVDNDDELILVCRTKTMMPWYKTHRVDLDVGKTVPMDGLRGRAVFLGTGRTLSVPAGLSSSISADTVYVCRGGDKSTGYRPRINAYHLLDGSTEYEFHGDTIVDCLSCYVCGSEDSMVGALLDGSPPRKRKRKANPKVIGNEWVN